LICFRPPRRSTFSPLLSHGRTPEYLIGFNRVSLRTHSMTSRSMVEGTRSLVFTDLTHIHYHWTIWVTDFRQHSWGPDSRQHSCIHIWRTLTAAVMAEASTEQETSKQVSKHEDDQNAENSAHIFARLRRPMDPPSEKRQTCML